MKPHKHADVLRAIADGYEVEWETHSGEWRDMTYHTNPLCGDMSNWRIKPEAPKLENDNLKTINAELLEALIRSREALQFANDSPPTKITETIWMMHSPETLFDFMDAAIAKAQEAKHRE